jgi:glutamine synthetase
MSHSQPQPAAAAELPTPGLLTLDQLRHDVHNGSVRTIELALPDLLGRLKGKRYEATRFLQSTLKEGADMCAYLLAADADMTPLPGCTLAGWDTGYHDLRAMPDLTAIRRTPCQPDTVLIHADALGRFFRIISPTK